MVRIRLSEEKEKKKKKKKKKTLVQHTGIKMTTTKSKTNPRRLKGTSFLKTCFVERNEEMKMETQN